MTAKDRTRQSAKRAECYSDVDRRAGVRLRALRRAAGMSQDECARVLGMSRMALLNCEAGMRRLLATELVAVALVFKVSLDSFLLAETFVVTTKVEVLS